MAMLKDYAGIIKQTGSDQESWLDHSGHRYYSSRLTKVDKSGLRQKIGLSREFPIHENICLGKLSSTCNTPMPTGNKLMSWIQASKTGREKRFVFWSMENPSSVLSAYRQNRMEWRVRLN